MLDELYKDIGAKIKAWAKWIFVVEACCSIIGGFGLMTDDAAFIGFCVMVCGPLAAWISSWILYAFGQLVEDVHALRNGDGPAEQAPAKHNAEKIAVCQDDNTANEATEASGTQTVETDPANGQQCQLCGKYFDHLFSCKIQDDLGTRYRNICDNCKKSHNAIEQ